MAPLSPPVFSPRSTSTRPSVSWRTVLLGLAYVATAGAASIGSSTSAYPVVGRSDETDHALDSSDLRRRKEEHTATVDIDVASATKGPDPTTASESTTATESSKPLPKFFDSGSLAGDFSGNCPAFMQSFLGSQKFQDCYPFSMLLQGSQSFFEAEGSMLSITRVLDATCEANSDRCTPYLMDLANNLTDTANCGDDFRQGNQAVTQAYLGMVAYETLYQASCLKDPDSSAYCFANAVTNRTTASNTYFYFLPLNVSYPGSSDPTCNWCTQNTMDVFQSATANRNLPIADTYGKAAEMVNTMCGPTFVNTTLPVARVEKGAAAAVGSVSWVAMSATFIAALQLLL